MSSCSSMRTRRSSSSAPSRPNVLVKGGDYRVETVVGYQEVLAAGGRVEIVPTVEGFSTTSLVQRMLAPEPEEIAR